MQFLRQFHLLLKCRQNYVCNTNDQIDVNLKLNDCTTLGYFGKFLVIALSYKVLGSDEVWTCLLICWMTAIYRLEMWFSMVILYQLLFAKSCPNKNCAVSAFIWTELKLRNHCTYKHPIQMFFVVRLFSTLLVMVFKGNKWKLLRYFSSEQGPDQSQARFEKTKCWGFYVVSIYIVFVCNANIPIPYIAWEAMV